MALHLMFSAQVVCSALLWPVLFKMRSQSITIIATAWPFLLLSSFLGFVPLPQAGLFGVYLTLWLGALAFLSASIATPRTRLLLCTATTWLALGFPMAIYLNREFGLRTDRFAGAIAAIPHILCVIFLASAVIFWRSTRTSPATSA